MGSPKIEIESIGGACPVQATGTVNGLPFYFRARGGEWTLEVARKGEEPVMCLEPILFATGQDPSGGWMEKDEAEALIRATLEDFNRSAIEVEWIDFIIAMAIMATAFIVAVL